MYEEQRKISNFKSPYTEQWWRYEGDLNIRTMTFFLQDIDRLNEYKAIRISTLSKSDRN